MTKREQNDTINIMDRLTELIERHCFTPKWIKDKKDELGGNPVLIEKSIHAFALLGYIAQLEQNFVFKGGTSLLLHVAQLKRLSIDIDIILGGDMEAFREKLSEIPGNHPFIRFAEDNRGGRGLPNRKHFKFYYTSSIAAREESVLLDVVLENPAYIPYIETKQIGGNFLEMTTKTSVQTPTIEGLLGDKLTAFAPHTVGVPFETQSGNRMTMQVAKQLFDIGELFDIALDFDKISTTYKKTFDKENSYHDNRYTEDEVLQDTIDMALAICQMRVKGFVRSADTDRLEDGIRRLDSHLLNQTFRTDREAKIAAAKVFCVANAIKSSKDFSFAQQRYSNDKIAEIKDIVLPDPYSRLNRLKPILPEAFYYLWQGIK